MRQKKTRKTVAVALVAFMAITILGIAPSMAHARPLLAAICPATIKLASDDN